MFTWYLDGRGWQGPCGPFENMTLAELAEAWRVWRAEIISDGHDEYDRMRYYPNREEE